MRSSLATGTGATAPAATGLSQTQAMRAQLAATACEVPTKLLVRGWRGHRADRSGDIDIIPQEPDFVGTGGLPHSGPWDYVGQVPLLLYGPGHIQARGEVDRVVTLADIAPTQGELVDFPFDAPDGAPLSEALVPGADPRRWSSWWSGTALADSCSTSGRGPGRTFRA